MRPQTATGSKRDNVKDDPGKKLRVTLLIFMIQTKLKQRRQTVCFFFFNVSVFASAKISL